MPKKLSSRAKTLVLSVCEFFDAEKEANELRIPISASRERASAALKLSSTTIKYVLNEKKSTGLLSSPKKKRIKPKPITNIDEFTKSCIVRTIYTMYKNRKGVTILSLLQELKKRDIFNGSRSSLLRIMHDMGFLWKMENNRRVLMEAEHAQIARYSFLKQYMRNKRSENPCPVIFMDETWIFQRGSHVRSWQNKDIASCSEPSGEGGRRYIIVHAGSKNSFVEGASLIFASKQNTGDYHGEMNANNYIKWLEDQLLPSLEEPSIIVIDNAPYHSTVWNPAPTSGSSKEEIKKWLKENNINFEENELKIGLLEIVKRHKNERKEYIVDRIINQFGHRVLRLPPYHCQYNAIENIWGIAERYYNKNIGSEGSYTQEAALNLWQQFLDRISPEIWRKTVEHVEEIIEESFNKEVAVDNGDIPPFIITVSQDSSSSSDEN